ncbi:hypothetical protein CCS92_15750, partial [Methylobacterium radiotolerans]
MPRTIDPSAPDWEHPRDSVADRPLTKFRSRASTQGVLVTNEDAPRQVFFESLGEFGLLTTLLARQDVVDIREQQEAVYRDHAGVTRRHYFDFIVRMRHGLRKALRSEVRRVVKGCSEPGRDQGRRERYSDTEERPAG